MQWGTFMGHCSLGEFDIACNSSSDVLVQEGFMRRSQLWRFALCCLQYNCWDLNHIVKISGKWRESSVDFNIVFFFLLALKPPTGGCILQTSSGL